MIEKHYKNVLDSFSVSAKADEHKAEFVVEEIVAWDLNGEPLGCVEYLECLIKWDSCSHFWFGDDDSYLHLCGVGNFNNHVKLMRWLYDKAFELMGRKPQDGEEWRDG